jgi:hypothetical protein
VKKLITLAVIVMAAFGITASVALAAPGPVSTGKQVCQASGQAVVNVHFTYTSPDSGVAGNTWANDTINRQLQIWQTGSTYCASVTDQGSFVTAVGPSPSGNATVPTGITGKMKGGYTTIPLTLTGTFNQNGLPTRGDLGNYDSTNRPSFMSYGLDGGPTGGLGDWGWTYQTASNGTWVNAASGNVGDIKS